MKHIIELSKWEIEQAVMEYVSRKHPNLTKEMTMSVKIGVVSAGTSETGALVTISPTPLPSSGGKD